MPAPLAIVLPVRFNEAIRAAERRKVELPDAFYGELQGDARASAFTVSGLAGLAQIEAALDQLNTGLAKGMSFADWKAFAADQDWNLAPARLETILRTHAQTAYNAGAWERFDRTKDGRGWLMYSAINDSRTRPSHLAMDGIIRPIDDSFWDSHSPPCGFNCRCGLISLNDEQALDRGGRTADIPIEARADPGWGSRPKLGARALEALIRRKQLDLPAPLQDEVRAWHEALLQERIVDRVKAAVRGYDTMAARVRSFVRQYQGIIAEHEAVSIYAYTLEKDYY